VLVAAVATAYTLLVSVTSVVPIAYRSPSLHVAVETAAALIALLAAQLMYGRFRRSLEFSDLLLTSALALFAGSNLLFSAGPAMANAGPGPFVTWASAAGSALATALLAAGAFARPRPVRRPAAAARRALGLCALALAAVAIATAAARGWLPRAIEPGLSPKASPRPLVVGAPSLLVLQLVVMGLFAAAAIGFARRAATTRDTLMLWFAIGATLGGFARCNYFLFPSLYSEFFSTGDMLRLAFFVSLLIGGVLEISVSQHEARRSGVLEERRRLAREIHDGIAQDLAFITMHSEELAQRDDAAPGLDDIATAARRALENSRWAIAALVQPVDEPLADSLTRVADEAARRWGATVETHTAPGLELSPRTREALLRIVGEAVTNAARHGQSDRICVDVDELPELRVRIHDDGVGFDPAAVDPLGGRRGIVGMRDRAELVGGRLSVLSSPGAGTQIVMVLP